MGELIEDDDDEDDDLKKYLADDEDGTVGDKMSKLARPLIGRKAQICGLGNKSKFNGTTVTLETWDEYNQYFEARADGTELIIKAGIENLSIIDQADEIKDPREDLMVGRDEPVLFDGKQMYRKQRETRNVENG